MQKFLFRHATNLLQAFEPKLNILMYHRVMPKPDPLRPWEIDAQQFRKHMEWISGIFNVIPLIEAVEGLKAGTLKRRSLSITFDDGYLDNATEALPILKEFGFHATFFCTSAWLEGGQMWNDQIIESIRKWPENTISIDELDLAFLPVQTLEEKNKAIETILPKLKYQEHSERRKIASTLASQVSELPRLMMQPEHIKLLSEQGMEIGGHTHSHPIIANLDMKTLNTELRTNKSILEEITNTQLRLFAYPNGKPGVDFHEGQIQQINNQGYIASVTTEAGTASQTSKMFELPRFTPWDRSTFKFLVRITSGNLLSQG